MLNLRFKGTSIMKIFMKYQFGGPQNMFSLEKPTSKIYFEALHHLEDSESVKAVKRFFFILPTFVASPLAFN
jgi:hypothetical protein